MGSWNNLSKNVNPMESNVTDADIRDKMPEQGKRILKDMRPSRCCCWCS